MADPRSAATAAIAAEPLDAPVATRYHWFLLAAVGTSNFFEGFDQAILGLVAPYVARDFGLAADGIGIVQSVIGVGAVLALVITMQADRFGRRRMLLVTVVGYGMGTGLTALTQGVADFVALQLVTRMFLFAEVALAVVIVGEEFPARRRGFAIALLIAAGVAGAGASALALGPVMATSLGWRGMYALGLLPVLLVVPLRFGIRETRRYAAMDRARAAGVVVAPLDVWREPHRGPLVRCILLFGLVGALVVTFSAFFPYFLVTERGFTPAEVSTTYGMAALMGLPAIPLAGWLLDHHGRRVVGVVAPLLAAVALASVFNASGSQFAITAVAMAAAFAGTLALPIPLTYQAELFPTRVRSAAASWVSNGAGRALMVGSPAVTGMLAASVGSVGLAATAMTACGVAAAWLVYATMPETKGLPLEETARDAAAR